MFDKRVVSIMKERLKLLQETVFQRNREDGNVLAYSPFFTSMAIEDSQKYSLNVVNGGIFGKSSPVRNGIPLMRTTIRMGNAESGGVALSSITALPLDYDANLMRNCMKMSSTRVFESSIQELEAKYLDTLSNEDPREIFEFFSYEPTIIHSEKPLFLDVKWKPIERSLKNITKILKKESNAEDVIAMFNIEKVRRHFINSEGSDVFKNYRIGQLSLSISKRDGNNFIIPLNHCYNFMNTDNIPSEKQLLAQGRSLSRTLDSIIKAPFQQNGTFPMILDAENSGVIAHEVVGHGCEGHRVKGTSLSSEDGTYYIDRSHMFSENEIGKIVCPEFIDLYDDPTIKSYDGISLNGSYNYDDEGVKARRVDIFKKGVLNEFLHNRSSAGFFGLNSNGHARGEIMRPYVSRMGNIFLKSHKEVSFEQLKKDMFLECEKRGLDYGLYVKGAQGGMVLTEESFYNTVPQEMFRMYTNGKVERVRGSYIVGTPRQALSNIVETSNRYKVFNGYCGAESGSIPNAEVAPDMLIRNLEVNTIPRSSYERASMKIFD